MGREKGRRKCKGCRANIIQILDFKFPAFLIGPLSPSIPDPAHHRDLPSGLSTWHSCHPAIHARNHPLQIPAWVGPKGPRYLIPVSRHVAGRRRYNCVFRAGASSGRATGFRLTPAPVGGEELLPARAARGGKRCQSSEQPRILSIPPPPGLGLCSV